ncbi:hypothetical protein JRI60_42855 [Archangium violaceum]|uniref:hypothetical protein n=1 Tax=Archangium violaceum TaxID=83451 RepID=UPI00194FE04F|nr:hypothetical protein [Archangium violaceum]QRN95724.1 hypothetical protein JRI60_42855 [Archangium violaceum]
MDPLTLRFIERLTAVLLGGMTIYLGFRLFRSVPKQRDSSGKVTLPLNTSIAVTRVGPGVLFALFGIVAVGLSLLRPLNLSSEESGGDGTSYFSKPVTRSEEARANARAQLRRDIGVLNNIPQQLREDLAPEDRGAISRSLTRVKLSLMESVWGTPQEGFGDFAQFEQWVRDGEKEPPPAEMEQALALYRYGRPGGTP